MDRVKKLNKAIYGLRAAPRAWDDIFAAWVTTEGDLIQREHEHCLFCDKEGRMILIIYVDDILVASELCKGMKRILDKLKAKFRICSQ
jgi:hypothetical protein